MRNLKEYRTHMGKTQKNVADFLGIERSTYAKYENGSSEPTFDTLKRLSEYFGASVDELMGSSECAPSSPRLDADALKAAFWGGEKDLTQEDLDAMWNDVERFAAFLAEKKRQEKHNG